MIEPDQRTIYGIMAVVSGLYLGMILWTGDLGLVKAPEVWRKATRQTDPGKCWMFVVGLSVVTLGLAFSSLTGIG